jgi:hypothetical protein
MELWYSQRTDAEQINNFALSLSSYCGKYWYSHWLGQNSNDKHQVDGNKEVDKVGIVGDNKKS